MDAQKVPQGMGSGFFWDAQGHIVTNFHVIRGATDIKVALIDQSVYTAKVGHHRPTDCQGFEPLSDSLSMHLITD